MFQLYPLKLQEKYDIVEVDEDFIENYELIARKRGAISKGGVPDYERVSEIIVRDLKNGALGNVTFDRLK